MPLVEVTRGPLVESVHAVAACAVDERGETVLAVGDVDTPVYLRSTAKPFIAAAVVASGAAERFAFSARELAVISASHNGEPAHVETVRGLLARIGLDESALQCGAHAPSYEPAAAALAAQGVAPSALHNNCSGKHAGILALCVHLGLDIETYLRPEHPAQQRILALCARLTDDDEKKFPIGIDGCGIPVFATSLRQAALAFARFATLKGIAAEDAEALNAVREAIASEPFYVAGSGRFDTALIEATSGNIVCKGGAEGVHGSALRRQGLGLVLKVLDGTRRATPPAALALLGELGALSASEAAALHAYAERDVHNVAGTVVGRVRARLP